MCQITYTPYLPTERYKIYLGVHTHICRANQIISVINYISVSMLMNQK